MAILQGSRGTINRTSVTARTRAAASSMGGLHRFEFGRTVDDADERQHCAGLNRDSE